MSDRPRAVPLRLSPALFERLEIGRGNYPREPWIREAIEMRLDSPERLGHDPTGGRIRASEQVKANVAPIPKGG